MKDYRKMNVYRNSYSLEELKVARKKLAKTANRRLRRLRESNVNMGDVPALSYLSMNKRKYFSESERHFKESSNQLKMEISILQGFLESKRTTLSGRKEIKKKIINTFKRNNDVDLTDEQAEFLLVNMDSFRDGIAKHLYDSKQVVDIFKEITHTRSGRTRTLNQDDMSTIVKALQESTNVKELRDTLNTVRGVRFSSLKLTEILS